MILEPAGNLWGSERFLLDFLKVADYSSWDIAVCCPPNSPILEELESPPIKVFSTFRANLHLKNKIDRLHAARNLLIATKRFRAEVIFVNQAGATKIALLVGRILKIPVVTHVQLAEDVQYISALNASPDRLPRVICDSEYIMRLFPDTTNQNPKQLVKMYSPYVAQYSWERDLLAVDPEAPPAFSCVGRLARVKAQDVLLRAVQVLKHQRINAKVTFVGAAAQGDDFDKEVKTLADSLNVNEQIIWAGFQKEVFPWMKGCVAQVVCSHIEPLGRVVFEAWDMGIVPIVWAGAGGAAEIIQESGGGVLYEYQNEDCLAETLKQVWKMPQFERQVMIEQGRNWLRSNCDPNRYASEMLRHWEDVVAVQ